MQIETTDRICPLCKREDAGDNPPGSTRLCRNCRVMIETILPKMASGVAVAQPQYAVARSRRLEVAAPLEFGNEADATEHLSQEEDYELVSLEPEVDVKKDFMEEPEESFVHIFAPDETALAATSARRQYAEPETFTPPPHSEVFDETERASELSQVAGPPRGEALASEAAASEAPAAFNDLGAQIDTAQVDTLRTLTQAEDIDKSKAATDESATDPWDDPLPAWEYSRNEWPLLVEDKKPSALARFKVPIAIAILIASAAAVYFFLLKQRAETPQEPIAVVTPEVDKTEADKTEADETEAQKTPATADAEQQAAAPAQTAATPTSSEKQETPAQNAATEDDNIKWRHSLQAMASPTEAEANQFAERLVRAGVPAYVVSADLGQRGKWYRVRVGRFTTAADALRFAAEARQRAKAAGVTLNALNLCEYEKP